MSGRAAPSLGRRSSATARGSFIVVSISSQYENNADSGEAQGVQKLEIGENRAMPQWNPTPNAMATYIGRNGSSKRNMMVVAEAVGGRFVVEAIGRKGILVRLTVKRESLVQPQPDLFA
jgi:hypothetical protein